MNKANFEKVFSYKKPIIGMVHLKALPGSPAYAGHYQKVIDSALFDAQALADGGVDSIMIENQFDTPYNLAGDIGVETVAFLSVAALKIKERFSQLPIGINVHLNGAIEAMAVAKAVGAEYIRVFNLMNAYISNSGYISAAAPQLMRFRKSIDAENVMVFGDFNVKHGSHTITSDRTLEEKAHDIQCAMADAAIITGSATGKAPNGETIARIKSAINIPLLIGSGLSDENFEELWSLVDGAIIGSGFKTGGDLCEPVDIQLVKKIVSHVH